MGTKENILVQNVAHASTALMPCCPGCKNRDGQSSEESVLVVILQKISGK